MGKILKEICNLTVHEDEEKRFILKENIFFQGIFIVVPAMTPDGK